MICPKCKSEIVDDSVFCSKCGINIQNNKCPNCNTYVNFDDEFCSKCGTKFSVNNTRIEEGKATTYPNRNQVSRTQSEYVGLDRFRTSCGNIINRLFQGVKTIVSVIIFLVVLAIVVLPFTGKLDKVFNGSYGSVYHENSGIGKGGLSGMTVKDSDGNIYSVAVDENNNAVKETDDYGNVCYVTTDNKLIPIFPNEAANNKRESQKKIEKTGLSTVILGKYEIMAPDYYDYVSSKEIDGRIQHYDFLNKYDSKDGFSIDILEKGEEKLDDLVRDSKYWMKYDLENGARLADKTVEVGEFEGIMAVYDNDTLENYRISSFLVNDKDRCVLILYGMSNPMDVLGSIEIYGISE